MAPHSREETKRILEILNLLKQELPGCFKEKGPEKVPLKCGFDVDLIKYYKKDTRFTAEDLHQVLYLYINTKHYLQNLKAGTPRYNLQGKKVGKVTEEEEAYAKQLLARHEKRKFESEPGEYSGKLGDEDM